MKWSQTRLVEAGLVVKTLLRTSESEGLAAVFSPLPNTPMLFSRSVAMMPSPFLNWAKDTLPHSQFLCRPNTFSASR